MKKLSVLLFLFLVCTNITGCLKNNESGSVSVKEGSNPAESNSSVTQESSEQTKKIDVDLTVLSTTMVYAEVFNMLENPGEYMGKTIKAKGPYYASFYDETGLYYHYVIVEDAEACCQSGLEFIWAGEHKYPEDYPKEQEKIEIIGIFDSYEELGETFYYLAVDDVLILDN